MSERPARPPLALNPMRRQLLAWFKEQAPSLADAYEGAVSLLADGEFPGRIHFIAHAVRDIADRLVYVLDRQLQGGRVQYENTFDRIEKDWPDIQVLHNGNANQTKPDSVEIDFRLATLIDGLVQDHRARRKRLSHYELLFRYLMRNEPYKARVNRRLVDEFKGMREWFMAFTHLRRDGAPQVDERDLQLHFYRFERMLHSFVGDFFTGSTELDDILQQANQRSD